VAAFRLARHRLDARAARGSAAIVAGAICGLHAQVLSSADFSLWARVRGHRAGDLARLLWDERVLVKTWLMRGTLHLVPADDLPLYAAAIDPGRYEQAWLRYFEITTAELERLIEAIGVALDGHCLDRRELAAAVAPRVGDRLAARLGESWGTFLKPAARRGLLCFGPSRGANVTFARPDRWIGRWRQVEPDEARGELVRRYLAAYGPATRDDFLRWIGVRAPGRFREAWVALAESGTIAEVAPKRWLVAVDAKSVRGARRPDGVRLLPPFDPFLLGHEDRAHLVEKELKPRVYRQAGWVSPVVLEAGRIAGVWSYERGARAVKVRIEAFGRMSPATREAVRTEAAALAGYLGGELALSFA
jgi:uncharacterized protein YcaQ